MDAARRFYVDILGFEVENDVPGEAIYLTTGGDSLALQPGEPSTAKGRLDHIGIMVDSAEQVSAWEAHLLARRPALIKQAAAEHRQVQITLRVVIGPY